MARELLGQKVTRALRSTGVERVVTAVTRRLGVDCGCAKRAAKLDQWHARRRIQGSSIS